MHICNTDHMCWYGSPGNQMRLMEMRLCRTGPYRKHYVIICGVVMSALRGKQATNW